MKLPTELAAVLARQWHNADYRATRLLEKQAWPLELTIGAPSAKHFAHNLEQMIGHINAWKNISIGEVVWQARLFRSIAEPVNIPVKWRLASPSQWIAAMANGEIAAEFKRLEKFYAAADPQYHALLIRQRHLWREKSDTDVLAALALAAQLAPGCAAGAPLRALGIAGTDSKFYERNRQLIIQLLDSRFAGTVTEQGLEVFLGAADNNDHWLLIADLDGSLLPFPHIRVSDKQLLLKGLPGSHILIVENERCHYQLPKLPGTLAILGAGQNLSWLAASWLATKNLAYWGDMDTWGLTMLAKARNYHASIKPLLMSQDIFTLYSNKAVSEPVPASELFGRDMVKADRDFFYYLRAQEKGRIEQEFIPADHVARTLVAWHTSDTISR